MSPQVSADTLLQLFLAVLLERRVLLRSSQYWIMTVAAEALCQLLHPFKLQVRLGKWKH